MISKIKKKKKNSDFIISLFDPTLPLCKRYLFQEYLSVEEKEKEKVKIERRRRKKREIERRRGRRRKREKEKDQIFCLFWNIFF